MDSNVPAAPGLILIFASLYLPVVSIKDINSQSFGPGECFMLKRVAHVLSTNIETSAKSIVSA